MFHRRKKAKFPAGPDPDKPIHLIDREFHTGRREEAVAAERRSVRDIIFRRIEVGIAKGLLSTDTHPSMLVDFAIAMTQGMSVLASDCADRASLLCLEPG